MKKGKMLLALAAGLCVATISSASVNAGGYLCDSCGRGLMNDGVEERNVKEHTSACSHHKYGTDVVRSGEHRTYDQCSSCGFTVYDGGWEYFEYHYCYGHD